MYITFDDKLLILCQVEKRAHGTIPMAFMRFAIKKGGSTQ